MKMREKAEAWLDNALLSSIAVQMHCATSPEQLLVWQDGVVTLVQVTSAYERRSGAEVIYSIPDPHCDCEFCTEWWHDPSLHAKYASKEDLLFDMMDVDFEFLREELTEKITRIPYGFFEDEKMEQKL